MRVLASVTGSISHTRAMSLAAKPLLAQGHELRIVVAPGIAHGLSEVARLGAEVLPELPDPLALFADPRRAEELLAAMAARTCQVESTVAPAVEGGFVLDAARRLIEEADRFGPDLILRDDTEIGAVLAAEHLGLPHVALCGALSNLLDPAVWIEPLNRHWWRLGHRTDLDQAAFYRYGRVDYVPERFCFARSHTGVVHRFQQPLWTRPGDRLPAWLAEVEDGAPFVYLSLGTAVAVVSQETAMPMDADPRTVLHNAIDALSEMDCVALVSSGGLEIGRALPRHVRVAPEVPQTLVLERANLFLTHGGYNSIREAVRSGTPMLALPCFSDQPHLAARIEELALGRALTAPSAEQIRVEATKLLQDRTWRDRARTAQAAMLTLPPLSELPPLLGEIAGTA